MTDEDLADSLAGLYAYDTGCVDSGIHDERLRQRCIEELGARPVGAAEVGPRLFLSRMIRDHWLSEEALEQGYGIEDVLSFAEWLGDYIGLELR